MTPTEKSSVLGKSVVKMMEKKKKRNYLFSVKGKLQCLAIQSKYCWSLLSDGEKRDLGTSKRTNESESSLIFFPWTGKNASP